MVKLRAVGVVVVGGMLTLATRVSPLTLSTRALIAPHRAPRRCTARLRSLGMTITTKPSASADTDADASAPLPAPISDEQRLTRFADSIALLRGPRLVSAAAAAAASNAEGTVVKSLVFLSDEVPVLVVLPSTSRVDSRKLSAYLGTSTSAVKLAPRERTSELCGFEPGCVPPVGHPTPLRTLVRREPPATSHQPPATIHHSPSAIRHSPFTSRPRSPTTPRGPDPHT